MDNMPEAWVLLAYRLPREPSTPRIALWRRLRRLGALQLSDGLVALPEGARAREQLEWLADEVLEAGGEASVWLARGATRAQGRALADRMRENVGAEYRDVVAETRRAPARAQTVARLRRALRAIRARDYFDSPERVAAEEAVESVASRLEAAA
jgi:hypothetical protein